MLKVSGIEISRRILRLALSRLSMPEETGQKPVNPTVLCTILDYICPCLTLLLFFIFLLHSCLLCLLFAFSCITKISTLSGGWLMVLSKLSLFFFNPLPHVIFLCICVTVICPLSLCVVHFLPLYADFFVTTFDSQLWWHSTPWSASRPKRHCTAYMCACVCSGKSMPIFSNAWHFVYVWQSKTLFLATSVTVLLGQLNSHFLYPLKLNTGEIFGCTL